MWSKLLKQNGNLDLMLPGQIHHVTTAESPLTVMAGDTCRGQSIGADMNDHVGAIGESNFK
jgi:hypothetical protein